MTLHPATFALLCAVDYREGSSALDVAAKLGRTSVSVHDSLRRQADRGLVDLQADGRWRVTPEGEAKIADYHRPPARVPLADRARAWLQCNAPNARDLAAAVGCTRRHALNLIRQWQDAR